MLLRSAVQAEEIAEAPEPMSEDALNYLLIEEVYYGTLSWQGNKASTKLRKAKEKIDKKALAHIFPAENEVAQFG